MDQDQSFNRSQEQPSESSSKGAQGDAVAGMSVDLLSAEIAVKFLGHKWLRDRDDQFRDSKAFLCSPENLRQFEDRYVEADEKYKRSNDTYWAKKPAQDIAAAMEVVEKMIAHGKSIQIRAHSKRLWNVQLVQIDRPVAEATEDTLPEAICRAALQATHQDGEAATTGVD